jgi:hypothetical protein
MRSDYFSVPPPITNPTPPPETECFETRSTALAAALIAADQLRYSHCRIHDNGKDGFYVFRDPLHVGEELQRRYKALLFPTIHARVLAEARGFLVDDYKRVLKRVGHGRKKV